MQRCAAFRATYEKQQTLQLWMEGKGRGRGVDSEVTLFEYSVSTILTPLVARTAAQSCMGGGGGGGGKALFYIF